MAGMEALGRMINVIPNVTTNSKFKVRGASGVTVVVTGATAVVTLAQDSTFGGSFATAAAVIKNIYWSTAADGTVAWSKLTYVNGTAPFGSGPLSTFTLGTTTGLTTAVMAAFCVFTSEFSDPFSYLKVTMTGSGIAQIIHHDLVHQRAPANLETLAS
jgi:hypothetical protein